MEFHLEGGVDLEQEVLVDGRQVEGGRVEGDVAVDQAGVGGGKGDGDWDGEYLGDAVEDELTTGFEGAATSRQECVEEKNTLGELVGLLPGEHGFVAFFVAGFEVGKTKFYKGAADAFFLQVDGHGGVEVGDFGGEGFHGGGHHRFDVRAVFVDREARFARERGGSKNEGGGEGERESFHEGQAAMRGWVKIKSCSKDYGSHRERRGRSKTVYFCLWTG